MLARALCRHVGTFKAPSFPLTPIYICDHRAVPLEFFLPCTSVCPPWRSDGRILRNPLGCAHLEHLQRDSLASSDTPYAPWDSLNSAWQVLAAIVGRDTCHRHNYEPQHVIASICILQRGDTSYFVMRRSRVKEPDGSLRKVQPTFRYEA